MRYASNMCQVAAVVGLLSAVGSSPTTAESVDKAIVSRTAEVFKLYYAIAGHGAPLILLHGYAETSRM